MTIQHRNKKYLFFLSTVILLCLFPYLTQAKILDKKHKKSQSNTALTPLTPAKKVENVTELTMWIMPNSSRPVKDLKKILARFEIENPSIKVTITSVDWGAALTKLTTAAISKEAPDITQLGTTWVGVISATGALEDLSERVKEIGGKDTFLDASWATSGLVGSGKTTAVPWFVDARALYYRTDVFKKLGLTKEDISDYKSFEKTLEKIKNAKLVINEVNVKPLGVPGKNDWNVLHNIAPWVWSWGGHLISDDYTKSTFQESNAIKGIKYFIGLADKGYIPKACLELNTAQVAAKFNDGEYALYFDTPAQIKLLTTPTEKGGAAGSIAAQNFDVTLYPEGPSGRYTFFGGSNLAIFKSSKHKEAAWKVVKYLTSKEMQLKYSEKTGFIPARKDCFQDPYFTRHPQRKVFVNAIKYGRAYPCISAWGPIEPIMMRHIGIIWDHAAGVYGTYNDTIIDKELEKTSKEVDIILSDS